MRFSLIFLDQPSASLPRFPRIRSLFLFLRGYLLFRRFIPPRLFGFRLEQCRVARAVGDRPEPTSMRVQAPMDPGPRVRGVLGRGLRRMPRPSRCGIVGSHPSLWYVTQVAIPHREVVQCSPAVTWTIRPRSGNSILGCSLSSCAGCCRHDARRARHWVLPRSLVQRSTVNLNHCALSFSLSRYRRNRRFLPCSESGSPRNTQVSTMTWAPA